MKKIIEVVEHIEAAGLTPQNKMVAQLLAAFSETEEELPGVLVAVDWNVLLPHLQEDSKKWKASP